MTYNPISMIRTTIIGVLFLSLCYLSACNSDKPAASPGETPPAAATQALPPLPVSELQALATHSTGIDYSFFEPDFSLSMYERSEIAEDLENISGLPAQIDPACKLTAMIFFKKDTELLYTGELYFSDRCAYIIFLKNNQKVYANALSEDGKTIYKAIMDNIYEMQGKTPPASN